MVRSPVGIVDLLMSRRIRSIFWLMTFCILGINAFQGFWLWTTYRLNRQQFSQTVQDALFSVLQAQQMAQSKGQFISQEGERQMNHDTSSVQDQRHGTTSVKKSIQGVVSRVETTMATLSPHRQSPLRTTLLSQVTHQSLGTEITVSADTLAQQLSKLPVLDWVESVRLDLPSLSAAYQAELLKRGIDAKFRLDTLTINPRQLNSNGLAYQWHLLPKLDKRLDSVCTTPVPVRPVSHLFTQASFAIPTFYLLHRMGWLLGSSMSLLVLTTGCFLFMLTTILNQKKVSEVKNDFINNMTHELKTPIATVTAAIEALLYFGALNDPQKTHTYLTISQVNLQRLSELVEKVLNFGPDEKRDLVLHTKLINLADLADELITNHQLRATKPVHFIVNIPLKTTILADRVHFGNALNNLVDNAILYSHQQVTSCLTYQPTASGRQFVVSDDGIGIARADHSAIFDRFFRVPTGNLHPVKGFGFGLSYVRQVVERHGGRIKVDSEVGKGSKFVLDF